MLAHYFEGRIQNSFLDLDQALADVLPRLERYEGRIRLTRDQLERPDESPGTPAAAKPAKRRAPAGSPK